MNLNVHSWTKYKVSDIFYDFINGKGITEQEIIDNPGDLIAVQSSSENNACMGRIDEQYCREMKYKIVSKPCLTIARSGSAGFVSFQEHGCVIGDSAKALILRKDNPNRYHYLFIRTVLMANMYRYTYGRKVKVDKYMNMEIALPSDKTGEPDWKFMEEYMRTLHYKPISSIKTDRPKEMNIEEWHEYKLADLFEIKKGKRQHPYFDTTLTTASQCFPTCLMHQFFLISFFLQIHHLYNIRKMFLVYYHEEYVLPKP